IPFDPRQVPAPDNLHLPAEERGVGGLGIYLALGGVDQFTYERAGDRNRNVLVVYRGKNMPPHKGKIGVLIESHFDETEYRRFGEFFPQHGYAVEYVSHLWGQPQLTF